MSTEILGATGNLRAVTVLIVFAVVAHATLKGVLAPLRTALGSVTTTLPFGSLRDLPLGAPVASALGVVAAVYRLDCYGYSSGVSDSKSVGGAEPSAESISSSPRHNWGKK